MATVVATACTDATNPLAVAPSAPLAARPPSSWIGKDMWTWSG